VAEGRPPEVAGIIERLSDQRGAGSCPQSGGAGRADEAAVGLVGKDGLGRPVTAKGYSSRGQKRLKTARRTTADRRWMPPAAS